MIKTEKILEDSLEMIINLQEKDGWEFITAVQSAPASFVGDPVYRSFPAAYILFFRKKDESD